MGVESVLEDDRLADTLGEERVDKESYTLQHLIDMFGEEAVIRGIKYMGSLKQADKNFRESVDPDKMKEGYDKAGVQGEEGKQNASSVWEKNTKESGLGIADE